ncbi:MAG: hypothetical protein KJ622_08025 [Alphaproteobacteria bacterium]|nr:hypothetical protein [Alphaproteobacteria bacterium]
MTHSNLSVFALSSREFAIWLGCAALAVFFALGDIGFIGALAREDHFVENLTALFFVSGAGLCLWFIRDASYRLAKIGWIFLCLLFAGEETSWLQRVFDYSVPAVEQMNYQREFNLHNLDILGGHIRVQDQAAVEDHTGWVRIIKKHLHSQNLFNLGFFTYFLVLPILLWRGSLKFLQKKLDIPAFNPAFVAMVWACVGVTIVFTLMMEPETVRRHYMLELREVYMSLAILIHIFSFAIPAKDRKLGQGPGR